jgi:hypothetical protein
MRRRIGLVVASSTIITVCHLLFTISLILLLLYILAIAITTINNNCLNSNTLLMLTLEHLSASYIRQYNHILTWPCYLEIGENSQPHMVRVFEQ